MAGGSSASSQVWARAVLLMPAATTVPMAVKTTPSALRSTSKRARLVSEAVAQARRTAALFTSVAVKALRVAGSGARRLPRVQSEKSASEKLV